MSQPIKARVIVAFTDKNDLTRVYNVGDVFEGEQARIDELIASGHVETVDKAAKAQKPKG